MSEFMAEPGSASPHQQSSHAQDPPSSSRSHYRQRDHHRRSHREGSTRQHSSQMLEFHSAMSNFASMFPTLSTEVIESVLRANRGVVEPTIDQLIAMTATDEASETTTHSLLAQHPPEEGLGELDQTPAPAEDLTDRAAHRLEPSPPPLPPKTSGRTPRRQEIVDQSRTSTTGLRAPLVGALPDDFLRLVPDGEPQNMSSLIEDTRAAVAASNTGTLLSTALQCDSSNAAKSEEGVPLKFLTSTSEEQLAEDERIALYFQNAEFMTELRRNRDFIRELERDRASMARDRGGYVAGDEEETHVLVYPGYFSNTERRNSTSNTERRNSTSNTERRNSTSEPKAVPLMVRNETMERDKQTKKKERPRSSSSPADGVGNEVTDSGTGTLSANSPRQVGNEDMAVFQNRLRHMGQSTRKKFFQLAKKFQRHRGNMNLDQAVAGSTLQLIDDDSDEGEEERSAAQMFSPQRSKELGSRLEFVTEWPAQEERKEEDDDDELLDVDGIDLQLPPRTREGAHNEPIVFFSEDDADLPLGVVPATSESRA